MQLCCLGSEAQEKTQRDAPSHLLFVGKALTNNSL